MLEPVAGEPAAVARVPEPALVVADYHAGIEEGLREDGVELRSHAADRRESLLRLLVETEAERVVILGDLGHGIGEPHGVERGELEELFATLTERVTVTVTKGNHDGGIESVAGAFDDVAVADGPGVRLGDVGFCHGHTWPDPEVLEAPLVCTAHEHPQVRLEDEVGGTRVERVWLRGNLDSTGFPADVYDRERFGERLVVTPAFNPLVGGTYVNEADGFLSPFLPDGLADGEAYLLDGTRLGDYRRV